ncbi:MAG TPA: M20 family metallopeptidase [Gaiellaceae bacterium]|nr:M20 family metallopeptidase [Gaiellaceae bacterium]
MTARDQELLDWLRAREGEMATLLRALAFAESPSHEPGKRAAEMLADELHAVGYGTRLVGGWNAGDHLYACPSARRRHAPFQLLIGHLDTVWPLGTVEEMRPRIEDGRLYGPGVYDMKGGLVQLVYALRALRELGEEPVVTPVVLVTSDEETGSDDSVRWIRLLAAGATRVFVVEPPAGADGRLKTCRKGVGMFRVTVHGRAAHAGSSPEEGISAIRELARQVERLFALNDAQRGITVNVGTIDGGLSPNVVAPEAFALVDVRAPTLESAAEIEQAIRSPGPLPPGVRVGVAGSFARPPMVATAGNRALFDRARVLALRLGIDVREAALVGGASDANFTSGLAPTLDGLGALGDGAHAADEHVVLAAMPERAALLALLLLDPAEIVVPRPRAGAGEVL